MNYYFTGILILALCLMALFMKPAYPRNEYLNEYGVRCGEVDFRIEDRNNTQDYHTYNSSDYDNDSQNFSITFRKYLGTDCKTSKENVQIKQQLELMKMCGRVNSNKTLQYNSNFNLLVSKCRGVSPTSIDNRPDNSKSYWDDMKDDYKKENPNVKLMGDKKILKMPSKKKLILPLPKPTE
tara:strand:- start:156 stop:698 length:543 start_codon:yes stop_codon:yes gene_type:complete